MLRGLVLGLSVISILQASTLEPIEKLCMENNATACYDYALPLVTGDNLNVQEYKERGMNFMRKACILGELKACDLRGDAYYKDALYIAALPYLEKSCKRGVKSACEAVGTIYRDGHDVRPDDVKSRIFYEKACALGSGDACYNVAIIYRGGFGVTKSRQNEKSFYKTACDAGLKAGCDRYTELDNEDKGIETGILATIKSWFN